MAYTEPQEPNGTTRVRPDSVQFWAGGFATAVVAALIALVGVLVCRWTLNIPILAPSSDGAWGSVHTGEFVVAAALIAIAATGLLYLLLLGTPQPFLFFRWIMGLITVVAVVYPFSTGAPLTQKGATAVVDLVLGIAIMSLLTAVAARASRRVYRRDYPDVDNREHNSTAYRDGYRDGSHREGGYPARPSGTPPQAGGYRGQQPGGQQPGTERMPSYEPYEGGPGNVPRN